MKIFIFFFFEKNYKGDHMKFSIFFQKNVRGDHMKIFQKIQKFHFLKFPFFPLNSLQDMPQKQGGTDIFKGGFICSSFRG